MNKYDENYFNNITANGVISGDEIGLFIGRILRSTAIEERFQQAGGRRTKVRQTVLLTLMQHSFLFGKQS